MKAWFAGSALALVVAALACGPVTAGAKPSPSPMPATVRGHVYAWPTCPVEHPGQKCTAPLRNTLVTFTATAGSVRHSTRTDATGAYQIRLSAGDYRVVATSDIGISHDSRPVDLSVGAGDTVTQDIVFDTGIR